MNLKEAFRFQNRLLELMSEAEAILTDEENITRVETTSLRKKVMPEAENEVELQEPDSPFADRINELSDFLLYLLEQRSALAAAIRRAKNGMELDLDTESGLNRQRQSIAAVFQRMAALRSSERLISGGGTGFRFNAEGNQVSYRCDLKRVVTINFDRNKIRKLSAKLYGEADSISTRLDIALVDTEVDCQAPFAVSDTFAEVFEDYCERTR